MKLKRTPTSVEILEALRAPGVDFLSVRTLIAVTGEPYNRITASLHNLRRYRVVDVVVEADGTGWWFALPPESDQRSRICREIDAEIHRRRKPKQKPSN